MAEEDPSLVVAPVIFPRPVTGHRRVVQVSHPAFNNIPLSLLTTDASWSDTLQPNYINYAYTPPSGPKQRGVHSEGPSEVTWNISGELTNSTMGLLGLMDSRSRGVQFSSIFMSQGFNDSYLFRNDNGYSLPWSSFSLSGNPNGAVTFSLEGKYTQPPIYHATGAFFVPPDVPVPSWFTGNNFVTAWTLSHSVNIAPNWLNTASPYPAYYRPGHSEYSIQVTTKVALLEHSFIKFGLGGISMVEAVISTRNRTFGGRNEPVTYQATTTNAKVALDNTGLQNAFLPSIDIQIPLGPAAAPIY